ncbi:hypothetical protein HYFRA_00008100, partial [Hymenoscyphus fraxineus]
MHIPMAPLKRPQPLRSESATSVQTIQIRQDVTVTTSTIAEGELNEPHESVSIETTGGSRGNTNKATDASQPGLLSRWSSVRRGSTPRPQSIIPENQEGRGSASVAQSIHHENAGRRGSASVAHSVYQENVGRRGSASVAQSIHQENVGRRGSASVAQSIHQGNTGRRGSTSTIQSIYHEELRKLGSMSRAPSPHLEAPSEQTFKDFKAVNDQRDGMRALADFLKDVPPPSTNNMLEDLDEEPKKSRSVKSALLSIFGRKKKKKKKQERLIMLPDSAIAATTTSGARYISISIPQTATDGHRSRPNTASRNAKMNLTVLNSVAEVSEGSQRNTIISSDNHSPGDGTEEKSSPFSGKETNADEEREFYREQRISMSHENDTPTRRPRSTGSKVKKLERPRSARYSIFPAVTNSGDGSVPNSEPPSGEAQRQSGESKIAPAGASAPPVQIPIRYSSLYKVPIPQSKSLEQSGNQPLADGQDTEDNVGPRDSIPEFHIVDLPGSPYASTVCNSQRHSMVPSTFCDSQRQSMALNPELSQLQEDESKRTVSSSTFGTRFGANKRVSLVIQRDSSRPVSLLPSEIQAARERAFHRLSSITAPPAASRQELVRARKARDMLLYSQQNSFRPSTPRIYALASSAGEEDELATTISAGRTAQASRRRLSIPLCEQLVADFSGPNHRGNDTDLYYSAHSSMHPSPLI